MSASLVFLFPQSQKRLGVSGVGKIEKGLGYRCDVCVDVMLCRPVVQPVLVFAVGSADEFHFLPSSTRFISAAALPMSAERKSPPISSAARRKKCGPADGQRLSPQDRGRRTGLAVQGFTCQTLKGQRDHDGTTAPDPPDPFHLNDPHKKRRQRTTYASFFPPPTIGPFLWHYVREYYPRPSTIG